MVDRLQLPSTHANGKMHSWGASLLPSPSHALITAWAVGVYTTLRTIDHGRSVVEFDTHFNRLGRCMVREANCVLRPRVHSIAIQCPPSERDGVRERVLHVIAQSIQHAESKEASEYRVTVVAMTTSQMAAIAGDFERQAVAESRARASLPLSRSGNVPLVFHVEAVAEPLPLPPEPPISVQIETGTRLDPTIKSTAWIETRRAWERAMRPECEEVILVDDLGRLHEGLSSNLLVLLEDGITLRGAPRGSILQGSILRVITEEVAPSLNLCVQEAFPLVSELSSYRALFICSTGRLLLPVDRVYHDGGDAVFAYNSSRDPVLLELQPCLQRALLVRATKLIQ